MNFLDIILIILIAICLIAGIVSLIIGIAEYEVAGGFSILLLFWTISAMIGIFGFAVVDKASGSTIGIITSVDKNYFGTTALYIKTTETTEEEYCIEFNDDLETKAKNLIGKKVKITYGKRVGLYSTGKCHQAPVDTIELFEEK